jgi:hypothetical protein
MSTNTTFILARFTNRNGTPSWRLSGWMHGVRIRRNFKSREDAVVQKSVLEIRAAQEAAGLRQTTTYLADTQLREAEDAFRRLNGRTRSLLFYLDYGLAITDVFLVKSLVPASAYLGSECDVRLCAPCSGTSCAHGAVAKTPLNPSAVDKLLPAAFEITRPRIDSFCGRRRDVVHGNLSGRGLRLTGIFLRNELSKFLRQTIECRLEI